MGGPADILAHLAKALHLFRQGSKIAHAPAANGRIYAQHE